MNKVEINDRIKVINERLNGMVSVCKTENRMLTDAENAEKEALIEERGRLKAQIEQINSNKNFKTMENETPKFNLGQALRNAVNRKSNAEFDEYFNEIRNVASKMGIAFDGNIQMRLGGERRALNGILQATNNFTSDTYNGGKETVPTEILPIYDHIYNRSVLGLAGATIITGLTGNVQLPTMSAVTCDWEGENDQAANGAPTFGKLELTPKRLSTVVPISKQLLLQSDSNIEQIVSNAIVKAFSEKLEKSILGDGTTPHNGIMYGATGVTEANLAYGLITDLEAAIQNYNFNPTFLVSPSTAALLKQKSRLSGGPLAIMNNGLIDDYPTFISNNPNVTSAKALIAADFSALHIGFWGDMVDITADPYSLNDQAQIKLVAHMWVDWGWANTNAYAVRKITAS